MVPAIETADWGCRGFASGVGETPEEALGTWATPKVLTLAFRLSLPPGVAPATMIEVVCNDRLGKKVRVKCKYPPRGDWQRSLGQMVVLDDDS